jgi:hypothetical protein
MSQMPEAARPGEEKGYRCCWDNGKGSRKLG